MDRRIALKKRTKLRFYNASNGVCEFTIQDEIGRGAASIVYNASYRNNSKVEKIVRMKECYPFALDLTRNDNGFLVSSSADATLFNKRKEEMRRAFDLGNEMFGIQGLTNYMSNAFDIYEGNNTVYIVTAYQEGTVLSHAGKLPIKDRIAIVKSIAETIAKIHDAGYLYLDIKPENIFLLNGTTDLIQLFDFDSIIPIRFFSGKSNDSSYKISYTKGFSALELQMGLRAQIGKHTDVFAIGAILFYLMFGVSPKALDCRNDAVYDFEKVKDDDALYQDKLYEELTHFLHCTLADYVYDRYQEMQPVVAELEKIERLADRTSPFLLSGFRAYEKMFVGREQELEQIGAYIENTEKNLLFVTGMGGIGKSALVRYYMTKHQDQFDIVLFLTFRSSLKQTIADDRQCVIHAVSQRKEEDLDAYFFRKLSVLCELTRDQKTLLVIDDFDGNDFNGMDELMQLGWKIIMITRKRMSEKEVLCLPVDAVQKREDIYAIFANSIGREIAPQEYPVIDRMIDDVQGHTLVLELIAKQIANSFLSIAEAGRLMWEKGFLNMAPEKVSYIKDCMVVNDTIRNIIDAIFVSAHTSEYKKSILKTMAFFGTAGIRVCMYASIYGMETKDVINDLRTGGWINIEDDRIVMHPVVIEMARHFPSTATFQNAARHIMGELRKLLTDDKRAMRPLCEEFIDCCESEETLTRQKAYKGLLFELLCSMPSHREAYILEHVVRVLKDPGDLEECEVLHLYEKVSEIYEEQGELGKAKACLYQAKQVADQSRDDYIKGQYDYLMVGYYDVVLSGRYAAETRNDLKILSQLMWYLDRAIMYMRRSGRPEAQPLLAEYLRCKANVLIRSNPKEKKKIIGLLNETKRIMLRERQTCTELCCAYDLTCAWYYTYVTPNAFLAKKCLRRAYEVEEKICESDLDFIDIICVPSANVMLECGCAEEAELWLRQGIQMCEDNEEVLPFDRKKQELYLYLEDVYRLTRQDET